MVTDEHEAYPWLRRVLADFGFCLFPVRDQILTLTCRRLLLHRCRTEHGEWIVIVLSIGLRRRRARVVTGLFVLLR